RSAGSIPATPGPWSTPARTSLPSYRRYGARTSRPKQCVRSRWRWNVALAEARLAHLGPHASLGGDQGEPVLAKEQPAPEAAEERPMVVKLHALTEHPPEVWPARAKRQWMDDFPDRHAYR